MFSGSGDVFGHLRMQAVGRADRHHLDVALFQHLAVIGKYSPDAVFCRKFGGIAWSRRSDRDDLRFVRHTLQRYNLNIRLELRTDNSNFYSTLAHFLSIENELRVPVPNPKLGSRRALVVAADIFF